MTKSNLPIVLTILVVATGLGLQLWYWPQLPQQVAIHFDAQGNPNNWLDKLPATLLSAGLLVFLPAIFVGISQIARRLPPSLINMPYRAYWLAPERRSASLQWMTGWMLWFALMISIFVLLLNHLTFVANRDARPLPLASFWILLGLYLFATFVMVLVMFRRFSKPTASNR